jgi:hypothetical protein
MSNPFSRLWHAVSALADAVLGLAHTVNCVNVTVQEQLSLPAPATSPLSLPAPAPKPEDIDHKANGYLPPAPPPDAQPVEEGPPAPTRRKARA